MAEDSTDGVVTLTIVGKTFSYTFAGEEVVLVDEIDRPVTNPAEVIAAIEKLQGYSLNDEQREQVIAMLTVLGI